MKKLSKSNYLKGSQCEKALFLHINHPELKDIPLSYPLNANQWLQVNAELNNNTIRNQPALDTFKTKLSYSLCFMDFETFQIPVPQFDNNKCQGKHQLFAHKKIFLCPAGKKRTNASFFLHYFAKTISFSILVNY